MKKFSIGFVSQDWTQSGDFVYPNGCTWYRNVLPVKALNSFGISAHVGSAAKSESGVLSVHGMPPLYEKHTFFSGHDIIVLKLAMYIDTKSAVEQAIAKTKQKIVVDIDDFFDNLPLTNQARKTTDPSFRPDNNRNIYFEIIEMSHALICSTPFLYDFYKNKYPGKPIFLVRNSIDIDRWPKRETKKTVPTIGWVGATPWRANDLEQLSGFFENYIMSRNNNFHHSGYIATAPSAAQLLGIKSKPTTAEPMKPITQLPILFNRMDIGIVPLNNIEFNHAKSYLKGLEYTAAGIPFVSSYSPEYKFLSDAGVGRMANNEKEWIYHLDQLQEFSMRQDEANINLEIVKEQFSIQSKANEWLDVFTKIMDL